MFHSSPPRIKTVLVFDCQRSRRPARPQAAERYHRAAGLLGPRCNTSCNDSSPFEIRSPLTGRLASRHPDGIASCVAEAGCDEFNPGIGAAPAPAPCLGSQYHERRLGVPGTSRRQQGIHSLHPGRERERRRPRRLVLHHRPQLRRLRRNQSLQGDPGGRPRLQRDLELRRHTHARLRKHHRPG